MKFNAKQYANFDHAHSQTSPGHIPWSYCATIALVVTHKSELLISVGAVWARSRYCVYHKFS